MVVVERVFRHPRYERVVEVARSVQGARRAEREHTGDRVLIEETRPLSKDKRWRIREILERAS